MFSFVFKFTILTIIVFLVLWRIYLYDIDYSVFEISSMVMGYTSFVHILLFTFLTISRDIFFFPSLYHLLLIPCMFIVYIKFYRYDNYWLNLISSDIYQNRKSFSNRFLQPATSICIISAIFTFYHYTGICVIDRERLYIGGFMILFSLLQQLSVLLATDYYDNLVN
ncbi:hypothetical protein [Romboutsia sp. 1001285H_161024_C4]|uniref:hypothetical protein n=1 Tax=Romboutsia sp. 1001285H_161024_C4 TaxID=2787109 RepID=UPI00189B9045|nr:hypothetical protein [Romboutsia sp. 1001285H_161024_C4]